MELLKEHTDILLNADVSKYVEKKGKLSYLSWANALREVLKIYPNIDYVIKKNEEYLPYFGNESVGYMCYTTVTIAEKTRECWLPIMDGANKTMFLKPYEYTTKYGEKTVEALNMFDINKTVMRCLVKNLAMFGLGLHIYAGEDLPEVKQEPKPVDRVVTKAELDVLIALGKQCGAVETKVCKAFGVESYKTLTKKTYDQIINGMNAKIAELAKESK